MCSCPIFLTSEAFPHFEIITFGPSAKGVNDDGDDERGSAGRKQLLENLGGGKASQK